MKKEVEMIVNLRPAGGYVFNKNKKNITTNNQSSLILNNDVYVKHQNSYSDKARIQNSVINKK
jgi:hypothetical protein